MQTRRAFLGRASGGLGALALASLLEPPRAGGGHVRRRGRSTNGPAWSSRCTSPPRAKRVIYLYMAGGPSHLETFDYKPKLAEMHGKPMPESFTKGQPIAQLQGQKLDLLRRRSTRSSKFGKSGQEICRDLPAHRHGRRRHLHRPLDADRGDQSRSGPHVHEHRHDDLGPAGDGLVAQVRPGQRERRPARLRRADLDRARAARRSRSPRGSGTAASCPAGSRASSSARKGDPVLYVGSPAGVDARRSSATSSTPCKQLNRMRQRGRRRSRRSPRASASTRWRSACRRACRS